MFLLPVTQNRGGGERMKKDHKELDWTFAQRGIPIKLDPALIVTDPNGSYTGRPKDPEEKPIQDADDL